MENAEKDIMDDVLDIQGAAVGLLAAGNLLFLLGLGVFTLHRRFRYLEEWSLQLQAAVLILVAVLCAFELHLLGTTLHDAPEVYHVFSNLGILASVAALYGHLAVSLCSQLLVDWVMPGAENSLDQPHFGPAEALERRGDFAAAAQEYLVLARLFPQNPQVSLRLAESLVCAGRDRESLVWFVRALKLAPDAPQALPVLWRLTAVITDKLQQHRLAAEHMHDFLGRFPGTHEAASVQAALVRLDRESGNDKPPAPNALLLSMADQPLEQDATGENGGPNLNSTKGQAPARLERMDTHPLSEDSSE